MKPLHARPTTKADETTEFKEFWEEVWRPMRNEFDGRASARDRFFHHVWWKGADPQDIVDAARYYAMNRKTTDKQLLAAHWLDRGMYEDDAERWRANQQAATRQAENVVQFKTGQTAFLREYEANKARES